MRFHPLTVRVRTKLPTHAMAEIKKYEPRRLPIMQTVTDESPTCDRFLHALAKRDWEQLEGLLDSKMRFHALVPGPNNSGELRTSLDRAGAVRYLRGWFGGADHFEIKKSEVHRVASRYHFSYLIRLHDEDGWQVIEQRAYCDIRNGLVEGLDLLCSGFMPDPQVSP